MPKMKFGVGNNVSTDSGFTPYEGPLPKPAVIYPVVQKTATIRLTGENSKNPGTPYINTMWEIESGECQGFPTWHRLIPGEHEIQQTRIAQYMQAVCGKNAADVVHDDPEDGGKIKTIGGRKPEGVKAGMTFQRKKDTRNAIEGEEVPWTAESADIIPGWKPKSKVDEEDAEEPVDDEEEAEEEYEDDVEEEEAEEEAPPAKPASRRRAKPAPEPEPEPEPEPDDDDDDDDEDEDSDEDAEEEVEEDGVPYEDASKMSLIELKKLAKQYEYEDSDLNPFKGPAGKKKLLAKLVEDEIVLQDGEDDEPPF